MASAINLEEMKLLNKTNLYFLAACLLIFCLGGIFFYTLFRVSIDRDLYAKLEERKHYAMLQLERSDSLIRYQKLSVNSVYIRPVSRIQSTEEITSDTVIMDNLMLQPMSYRQIAFYATVKGRNYQIHIRRALIEQNDLIKGVVLLELSLFLAFVAILYAMNNQLSKSIWKPFYRILDVINNYKVDRAENLVLKRNTITEFNELAVAIEKMTSKIHREFLIQKEYTENASHEIQTPLAIIKNKMEILLQSPDLTEENINLIRTIYGATSRLSKLNEALIILSRIENRQFHEEVDVDVNDLIDKRLNSLEELIQMKNITVQKRYDAPLRIKMHPFLADILLENLIINAIKHNHPSGSIQFVTENSKLSVINTGDLIQADPETFFRRFAKANQKSASLGLGLSIVKAICDTYNIPIYYRFENNQHAISLEIRS